MTDARKPVTPVGVVIVAAMRRRRVGTRRLAQLAGISHETLRRAINGYDPKLTTLEAIAAALHMPVAELLRQEAA